MDRSTADDIENFRASPATCYDSSHCNAAIIREALAMNFIFEVRRANVCRPGKGSIKRKQNVRAYNYATIEMRTIP